VFGTWYPGRRDHETAHIVGSLHLENIGVIVGQDRDIHTIGFAELSRECASFIAVTGERI
jgi:hypothetical protein